MAGYGITKYKTKYCGEAIDYLSKDRSLSSLCAHFDICRETLTNWRRAHPDFDSAIRRGREKAVAKFEEDLRNGITSGAGQYNAMAAALYARNVHGFDAKQKVIVGGDPDAPMKTSIEIKFVE